jgi:hypothetical protein
MRGPIPRYVQGFLLAILGNVGTSVFNSRGQLYQSTGELLVAAKGNHHGPRKLLTSNEKTLVRGLGHRFG